MKSENCYEIGVIQAFIDGELNSNLQENFVRHIAVCSSCSRLLLESEEENSLTFSALDEEINLFVPTERLRTKVFDSINESREKLSFWQNITGKNWLASGLGYFNSPNFVAVASLLLFLTSLGLGYLFFTPVETGDEIVRLSPTDTKAKDVKANSYRNVVTKDEIVVDFKEPVVEEEKNKGFRIVKTGGIKAGNNKRKINNSRQQNIARSRHISKVEPNINRQPNTDLSGEGSYLQTIDTLSKRVNANKDMSLRPKERVPFEREMAVVDDAIKKLKKEIRKHPKNKAARELLRSSYKNKIEILNNLAEKSELMASLD